MTSRGKHLLEAFKAAGPSASMSPSAPPPAAASAPLAKVLAPGAAPKSPSSAASQHPGVLVLNAPQLRLLGLVVLLMAVVAFLLGRMSVSRVALASGEGDAPALEGDAENGTTAGVSPPGPAVKPATGPANAGSAPAALDPNPRTPAEAALVDKSNVYTIKLIHYSNTEVNRRLAAETARWVESQNLPSVVAADSTGLYVLVGAAPRQVDLDEFLSRCKRLPGPPPLSRPNEYHSAYIEKIDKVFRRDK